MSIVQVGQTRLTINPKITAAITFVPVYDPQRIVLTPPTQFSRTIKPDYS